VGQTGTIKYIFLGPRELAGDWECRLEIATIAVDRWTGRRTAPENRRPIIGNRLAFAKLHEAQGKATDVFEVADICATCYCYA
jgi:hypothetical protein